jgi:5-methyltetrahydrofolate--homocysteine methyltransferase
MAIGLLERLAQGVIVVADGALGTQLQARGMPAGHCPEEYNVSHPDVVQGIHHDYYQAGSDFVSTNSFGGNRTRLQRHGEEARVSEFSVRAAQLARDVCPPGRWVAGSVGPTGEVLAPYGDLSEEDGHAIYAEQVEALAQAGVDFILVETMLSVEEAALAVRAAKERTGLPVAVTMSFQAGARGYRTSWGVTPALAVQRLTEAGADILGSNCGQGFDEMVGLVLEMRPLTSKPILAQANAGLPEMVGGRAVYSETPQVVAPKVEGLLRAGADLIGGCCGTTPAHVAVIRGIVNSFKR